MKASVNRIKLKIPTLIKTSGQLVFVNNKKSYQISNTSETVLDFVRKLIKGIGYIELNEIIKKHKQINTL